MKKFFLFLLILQTLFSAQILQDEEPLKENIYLGYPIQQKIAQFFSLKENKIHIEFNFPVDTNLYKTTFLYFGEKENNEDYWYAQLFWQIKNEAIDPVFLLKTLGYYPNNQSLYQMDVNKDGKIDLVSIAGDDNSEYIDEVFTRIYIQKKREGFDANNFPLIFDLKEEYASLFDLNGDGQPEIFVPIKWDYIPIFAEGEEPIWGFPTNPKITKAMNEMIQKIGIGSSAQSWIDYKKEPFYPTHMFRIDEPIQILQVQGEKMVEVTEKFSSHIRWRIAILKQIKREFMFRNKRKNINIDRLIRYWEAKI